MEVDADADAPVGSITGVSVDGVADDTVLVCACHGSEFDLRDGSVLQGPATEPLVVIPLVREGDRLRRT